MSKKKNKFFKIYFPIITFIVGSAIGIYSTRVSFFIAEKSGAFDKPDISLSMLGYEVFENKKNNLYYGFHFDDSSIVKADIPVTITNTGKKTAEDIIITLKYNENQELGVFDTSLVKEEIGMYLTQGISRKVSYLKPHYYVSYHIPKLNPNKTFLLSEPINLFETKVPINYTDTINNLLYEMEVLFNFLVEISISGKDLPGQNFEFNIASFKSHDMEGLTTDFVEEITRESQKIRDSNSLFRYLLLTFSSRYESSILIYPNCNHLYGENYSIYESYGKPNIREAEYKLIRLKYLFR